MWRNGLVTTSSPASRPNQSAYRANRSTQGVIAPQQGLTWNIKEATQGCFNTILISTLVKVLGLRPSHPICPWIRDFLSHGTQRVRVAPPHLSTALRAASWAPYSTGPITTTALLHAPAEQLLNLMMTQLCWASSLEIRRRTWDEVQRQTEQPAAEHFKN